MKSSSSPDHSSSRSSIRAFWYSFDDEDELIKKIHDTYDSDKYAIAVKPLLIYITEVIFHGAADLRGFMEVSLTQEAINLQVQDVVEELPTMVISAITYQIFSKYSAGEKIHTISMEVLEIIKDYNWDSKVVLAFLSFSVIFGELRLIVQHFSTTNPLAKAVALIKQCSLEIMEKTKALKLKLVDELFALFGDIMEVTKNIVEFFDFPLHDYFTEESPQFITANSLIPKAVYWAIRSIVVSAIQILALTGMGSKFLLTEQHKSAKKLKNIKGELVDLIESRNRSTENNTRDGYEDIVHILGSSNMDNSKSLKILLDKPGLYDCYNKKKISSEQLMSKVVALFITDLDKDLTSGAEYAILKQMYLEKWHNLTGKKSKYEVVWIPIVDFINWTTEKIKLFESIRNQMKCYSVDNPSNVDMMVIRFIKEKWNFFDKPLLVVMDTQGKIVHKNGIHMMCIWGNLAYPFTASREKLLWQEMSWSIDLLADNMELNMDRWIQEGKHICLYGGEDVNWITKFTKIAKDVASEAAINLELLYVGRSKVRKKLVNIIDTIQKENLSRTLDWNLIWYFWLRLESMLYSKQLIESRKSDQILHGIIALLSYDSKHQNWAIISCGSGEMVMANGEYVLKGLRQLRKRKPRENKVDIVHALGEYICKICPPVSIDYTSLVLGATESKKDDEALEVVARILESPHIHNSRSMNVLFNYGYGQKRALYNCHNKKQISDNDLRRKIVVLFITDLNPALLSGVEYGILHKMCSEKRQNPKSTESQYDVVWVPVVDFWVKEKYELFESLRDQMEWLSVHHPSVVSPVLIRYIKEKCNFVNKPILVVIDTEGKIVHHNAFYMMCIWGTSAYPFTIDREKDLWQEMNPYLLLTFNIEPNLVIWLQEGRHICLYGGEDMEWIRKFTSIAKDVAREASIVLELLYVGKNDANERVMRTIIDMIRKENLSRTLELVDIRLFWLRLESMWFSMRQLTKSEDPLQNDPIMRRITEMLNDDYNEQGWAMISRRQDEMVKGSGEHMYKALAEHEQWKTRKDEIGFVPALDEYLRTIHLTLPQDSTSLTLPASEKRKADEAFETLGRIFIKAHIDNSEPLSALFHYKDGQPALYDCYNKKQISTDELRRKIVALFITDLDPKLPHGFEHFILQQMYLEKRQNLTRVNSQYEVIWVPIAEYWDDNKYKLFESLRDQKEEWYSIHHPSVVSPVLIRYIKERWNFNKKPILVVMDTQGKIMHHNAIHMMCVFGSLAYPFTTNREKLLWEEMSWSVDLLADNLDPNLFIWTMEGRFMCLYGGEDIEWIQKFTRITKDVAREAGITIELLYVGKSKPKERVVRPIIEMIQKENLSRTLDMSLIWSFWMRLESMWYSKGQVLTRMDNVKNDPIMQGIISMLSYGSNEPGWALICQGFSEMVLGNGEDMLKTLAMHHQWKQKEDEIGFVPALEEHLHDIRLNQQATRIILPGIEGGSIPESVVCAKCGRVMEKYIAYCPCLNSEL